jgi:hypothetical protein
VTVQRISPREFGRTFILHAIERLFAGMSPHVSFVMFFLGV